MIVNFRDNKLPFILSESKTVKYDYFLVRKYHY